MSALQACHSNLRADSVVRADALHSHRVCFQCGFALRATYFSLLRQRKVGKRKATRSGGVALRHYPAMLGSRGRCGTRSREAARSDSPRAQLPLSLCFSAPSTGPNSTSKATSTAGACFARAASARDFGPRGRRREAQGRGGLLSEDLSEHGFIVRVPQRPSLRASQGSAAGTAVSGLLSLVTFFAEAKKVTRREAKTKIPEHRTASQRGSATKAASAQRSPAAHPVAVRVSASRHYKHLDSCLPRNDLSPSGVLTP